MIIQIKWNYQKCCSDINQDITEMRIQEDKGLTMENIFSQEKVIVIDFGGQYNQLVARRVKIGRASCRERV